MRNVTLAVLALLIGWPGHVLGQERSAQEKAIEAILKLEPYDTEYAPGYSEQQFQAVKVGESTESVKKKLGRPLEVMSDRPFTLWLYAPDKHPNFKNNGDYPLISHACNIIRFDVDGRFVRSHGQVAGERKRDGHNVIVEVVDFSFDGSAPGPLGLAADLVTDLKKSKATRDDIRKRFGDPQAEYVLRVSKWMVYSRRRSGTYDRKRLIGIDSKGRVCKKTSEMYWD